MQACTMPLDWRLSAKRKVTKRLPNFTARPSWRPIRRNMLMSTQSGFTPRAASTMRFRCSRRILASIRQIAIPCSLLSRSIAMPEISAPLWSMHNSWPRSHRTTGRFRGWSRRSSASSNLRRDEPGAQASRRDSMSGQILIVGCGAIGGLFAAALSSVAKVTAFDANAEHVTAINARGLRVAGKSPRTVRIDAAGDPAELKGTAFDAVIFLIKSKMTAAALAQLRPVLAGNPLLVTLQNGMGNAEVLLSVPNATVARGVTMNAGRYVEPGCVECLIEGKTWLGPARGRIEDVQALAGLLNTSGMETEVVADPMAAVWSKFVFNCVMNPLGALMMGDNVARHDAPEM